MLHKHSLLFLLTLGLVHASTVPGTHRDTESLKTRNTQDSPLAVLLDTRAPPPKNTPKTIPKTPTKPAAGAPVKPDPKAGTKPAQPAPAAGKAPAFPQLPVPYNEEATDLCDIYIDCNAEEDGTAPNVKSRRGRHDYYNGYDRVYEDDRVTLSKRARLSSTKLPGGPLALAALSHPSSGELYSSPRHTNPKEVYDFKDNKLGTTAISMSRSLTKPSPDYVTEHIIELQTLGMFMVYATKQDKTLEAFFRNKFVKLVPGPLTVSKRPNPPSYKLGTEPAQDSLMLLVFEAIGSTINPTDFVLCEASINTYKMLIWSLKEPMSLYKTALEDAMAGVMPLSDFLSALRLVFGVYGYMNSAGVVAHMKKINKNIRLELANAGALYNELKINLVLIWDKFIAKHFKDMDTEAKKWVTACLPKTKLELAATVKKYTTLAETLKKQETGKDAAKHAANQKKKQTTLEASLAKQKQDVVKAEKKVDDLKDQRALKPKPQGLERNIKAAKKTLKEAKKEVAKTQRKIHELYTFSVNLIVKKLEKDSQRVLNFEKGLASLKLTPP